MTKGGNKTMTTKTSKRNQKYMELKRINKAGNQAYCNIMPSKETAKYLQKLTTILIHDLQDSVFINDEYGLLDRLISQSDKSLFNSILCLMLDNTYRFMVDFKDNASLKRLSEEHYIVTFKNFSLYLEEQFNNTMRAATIFRCLAWKTYNELTILRRKRARKKGYDIAGLEYLMDDIDKVYVRWLDLDMDKLLIQQIKAFIKANPSWDMQILSPDEYNKFLKELPLWGKIDLQSSFLEVAEKGTTIERPKGKEKEEEETSLIKQLKRQIG